MPNILKKKLYHEYMYHGNQSSTSIWIILLEDVIVIDYSVYHRKNITLLMKDFSTKALQLFFFNKTRMVLDINEILYSCENTFDVIMYGTRFIVHGQP